MPTSSPTQSAVGIVSFSIKVSGTEMNDAFKNHLQRLEVERTFNRPDMCSLTFAAPEVSLSKPLPTYELGAELAVLVDRPGGKTEIFKGELTTVELEGRAGQTVYVMRGYDRRHRMYRSTTSRTYLQMTASDALQKLLKAANITATVAATSPVAQYRVQNGITDGDFFEQLLHESGYVAVMQEGRVTCKKLSAFTTDVGALEFGETLDSYTFRRNAQSWVTSVEVRDWDPKQKKATVGTATNPSSLLHGHKTNGKSFGDHVLRLSQPARDQSSATAVADAVLQRAMAGALELDGHTHGNEKLVPGGVVQIKGIDPTYNGKYRLSMVRHRWDTDTGFETDFSCNAATEASLTSLLAGLAATGDVGHVAQKIFGVVTAIVVDNKDTENLGRVQLKFPWLPQDGGKDVSSDLVRIASPGVGKGKGWFVVPEVNDEVLVAFEHGDPHRPYVLGGLYNSSDKPPIPTAESVKNGSTVQSVFQSRRGHRLTFNDSDDKPGVELTTPDKQLTMHLDDHKGDMTLRAKASGTTITVTAAGDITIKSENGGVVIESMKDIAMKATGNIKLQATRNVDIEGLQVNIKAQTAATIEGTAAAALKGAKVDVTGQAMTTITGGLVKIN